MFSGVYSSMNYNNNERIADIGGRKALGMGGSLTNYVNSGNPYKNQSLKSDKFVSSSNKKAQVDKLIDKVALLAIGGLSLVGLGKVIKKKGFKSAKLTDAIKNITSKFTKKASEKAPKKVRNKAPKGSNGSIKDNVSKTIKDTIHSFSDEVKKIYPSKIKKGAK